VISDGFCELFGYPKKSLAYEAMESSMYRNVHKDDVERIQDTAVRFAMDAGTYDVIYRVKLKTSNKGVIMNNMQLEILRKYAQDAGSTSSIWSEVKKFLREVKDKGVALGKDVGDKGGKIWSDLGPSTKSLIGAGLGAAVGTGTGPAVSKKGKRKAGVATGAILGALAGASAPHVNWQEIIDSFKNRSSLQHS
jgi:hypothetical protein